MNEKIIEAIITGTITAATWVVLVFVVNYIRNKCLESRLQKSFQNIGYTGGRNFGIILHNHTKVSVKVSIVLLRFSENMNYILNFSGKKAVEYKEPLNIPEIKEKEAYTSSSEFEEQEGERIIDLDFEMSGTWILHNSIVSDAKGYPVGGYAIVEYPTILGGRKRIKVEFNNKDNYLKTSFERHKKECETNPLLKEDISKEAAGQKREER